MPVPLPAPGASKQTPPDAAEARVIAGGVAAAVAPAGGLTGLQRMLIEAITDAMTGFVVPGTTVPRLDPREFARAMADRDAAFRARMLDFMLLCALVLSPLPEEVVERVESYARELNTDDAMLRVAQKYARGSLGLALVDFERSGYMETWGPTHSAALHTSGPLAEAWEQSSRDPELARRWCALRDLPEGTFGRAVANFYDARGFEFPGLPGSAPPLLAQHDWMHVLGNYGSTVDSELEVFAFIARANDDPRAFSLLAGVISLFETGYMATGMGLFQYDRGHLSHEGMAVRLADALRRGALIGAHAHGPDLLTIDWFERAHLPVDDVRAEFGVVPKSEAAVEAGSVTPWQLGGISPFQYEAGKRKAETEDRAYESFGATPT
jgi:hypothetical protein